MFISHKEQLSQLDSARLDLNHVLDERNQVLDLLSESVKPGTKVTRGQRIEPQLISQLMVFCSLATLRRYENPNFREQSFV